MEHSEKKVKEKESGKWLIPLMLSLLILAVIFGFFITIIYVNGIEEYRDFGFLKDLHVRKDWGVVGDFFGGILNPIFAFLGLIMLLATLYQSQKELALTREELTNTTKALQDQASTQKQQKFENTFFSLLEQHSQFSKDVEKTNYKFPWGDINAMLNIYKTGEEYVEYVRTRFREDIDGNYSEIRTYCTFLYQMLNFIKNNYHKSGGDCSTHTPITKESETKEASKDMRFYSNLIRASISNNIGELILINSICLGSSENAEWGYHDFKKLIEYFRFIEHVKIDQYECDFYYAWNVYFEGFELFTAEMKSEEMSRLKDVLQEKIEAEGVTLESWAIGILSRLKFYKELTRESRGEKYYNENAYGDEHFCRSVQWLVKKTPNVPDNWLY